MRSEEIIIVGSGPAGVSAAYPLVESGAPVLMLDGGRTPRMSLPDQPYLVSRSSDPHQWKWLVGETFHALKNIEGVSPKLRAPTLKYVFDDFEHTNRIRSNNFVSIGSLSVGGLSNAWGCGVARFSSEELISFPFSPNEMDQSYEIITKRIGVSANHPDDMSDFFGLDAWAQPAIPLDDLHLYLQKQYEKKRMRSVSSHFRMGRARVAVLGEDHEGRKKCDQLGNCLWGCHRDSMYSTSKEIPKLQSHRNFSYKPGFIVNAIVRQDGQWLVKGTLADQALEISARKVILAAGTLVSTLLIIKALHHRCSVPLFSCPTAAFLLWIPSLLGNQRRSSFGLGQLSFSIKLSDNVSGYGSTFSTSGIPVSEFVRHLPFHRRYGVDLLKHLLSSCLVGNLFLPGRLSSGRVTLDADDSLRIDGGHSSVVSSLMEEASRLLHRSFRQVGAIVMPMSFKIGLPGGDIHYAGTFPMRKNPKIGETDEMGMIKGLEGLYVVDGSCLPELPAKPHAFTIMANADRISRRLVASFWGEH